MLLWSLNTLLLNIGKSGGILCPRQQKCLKYLNLRICFSMTGIFHPLVRFNTFHMFSGLLLYTAGGTVHSWTDAEHMTEDKK